MEIVRSLVVPRPIQEVYDYLHDFTNTEEWDPGTIRTTLESGDGGVGSRYHNVSRFLGRRTELTYVVEEDAAPWQLRLRGENKTVVAHDSMTLNETETGGTQVTYRASFDFKGKVRLLAPLTAPAFWRLGNQAEKSLRKALG
ncbi:SRPBCC family protein [Nocardioides alcanivorans]|uniref:SRPBCC family protein n=1 Tax=Nocardioides alcanivorans TaxID=2897352 RepID=UPI001F3C804B|nr:SRPBCC family protein [Nocardioides alcanivorans]